MTLGERIKDRRTAHGLTQEILAQEMGVSRQAVAKWESGQSAPSSEKLIALAKLFHIPLDELIGVGTAPAASGRKPNPILRANLTRMAITLHAAFGYAAAQNLWMARRVFYRSDVMAPAIFSGVLLLLCSIWMASNHRFEPDLKQRRKNTRIELLYCLVQLGLGYLVVYAGIGLVGGLLMVIAVFVYIVFINPRYMNRKLTK